MQLVLITDFKSKNAPGGRAAARVGTKEQKTTGAKPSDGSSAGVNPLLVDLGLPSATTTRASMWFGQDEFKVSTICKRIDNIFDH